MHYTNIARISLSLRTQFLLRLRQSFKRGTPAKLIYTIGNLCALMAIPFRALQYFSEDESKWRIVEETLLVVAIPSIWFYLIFFAG